MPATCVKTLRHSDTIHVVELHKLFTLVASGGPMKQSTIPEKTLSRKLKSYQHNYNPIISQTILLFPSPLPSLVLKHQIHLLNRMQQHRR